MATARAPELRTSLLADAAALVQKLTTAAEQLQAAADPEAAEPRIEAVHAEAIARVADARGGLADEAQRRQQAGTEAEDARAAASEMDEQLLQVCSPVWGDNAAKRFMPGPGAGMGEAGSPHRLGARFLAGGWWLISGWTATG